VARATVVVVLVCCPETRLAAKQLQKYLRMMLPRRANYKRLPGAVVGVYHPQESHNSNDKASNGCKAASPSTTTKATIPQS
jgi:hypothetical protein